LALTFLQQSKPETAYATSSEYDYEHESLTQELSGTAQRLLVAREKLLDGFRVVGGQLPLSRAQDLGDLTWISSTDDGGRYF
jgi:hypothetical protein